MNRESAILRRWLLPLGLLVLVSDSGAEEAWPAKGDFVHIAASFKDLSAPSGVPNVRTHYDMPACVRLHVVKAKPQKKLWTIEDSMGGEMELMGAWVSRMHKGKMECEAQLAAEGEPKLGRVGSRFTLAPPAKGAPESKEKPK